jgi:hypothetical protein
MTKRNDPLEGDCGLHGKKKSYLYSQVLGGWVCQKCVEQGMFIDLVNDEMLKLYPSRIQMCIDKEKIDPGDWT